MLNNITPDCPSLIGSNHAAMPISSSSISSPFASKVIRCKDLYSLDRCLFGFYARFLVSSFNLPYLGDCSPGPHSFCAI